MTPREIAEEALKKAGYESYPDPVFSGRLLWIKDNATECVKTVTLMSPESDWFHFDSRGPLKDLPSLLSPSLTEAEKDALTFLTEECDDFADTLEGVHTDKSVSGTYRETSKVIRSLLSRLGGG